MSAPDKTREERWMAMRDDIARVLDVLHADGRATGGKLPTPRTPEEVAWFEERVRAAVAEIRA